MRRAPPLVEAENHGGKISVLHRRCRVAGALAGQRLARRGQVVPDSGELLVLCLDQRDVDRPHGHEEERHRNHDQAAIDEQAFDAAQAFLGLEKQAQADAADEHQREALPPLRERRQQMGVEHVQRQPGAGTRGQMA